MGVVAQVERAAVVDAEEVPVRVDHEGEAGPALHRREGRRRRRSAGGSPALVETKIGGGSAFSPDTSVIRFCSARLAVDARLRDGDRTGRQELAGLDRKRGQLVAAEPREVELVMVMSVMTTSPASSS